MRLLAALLTRLIRKGSLRVIDAGGRAYLFGEPPGNDDPLH